MTTPLFIALSTGWIVSCSSVIALYLAERRKSKRVPAQQNVVHRTKREVYVVQPFRHVRFRRTDLMPKGADGNFVQMDIAGLLLDGGTTAVAKIKGYDRKVDLRGWEEPDFSEYWTVTMN